MKACMGGEDGGGWREFPVAFSSSQSAPDFTDSYIIL